MEESKPKKKHYIRRWIVIIVLTIFVICEIAINRAEYLEIKGIGEQYKSIFFTDFYWKNIVLIFSFSITYILFFINNKVIKKGLKHFFDEENMEMPKLPNKSVSLIAALISGMCSLGFLYSKFITCKNASYFGIVDNVFGKDLGYYMFVLPFIKSLIIYLIVVCLVIVIYTAIYYVIALNVCFKNGVELQGLKNNTFAKQVKFWAILFGILICVYLIFCSQDILTGEMISIKDESSTSLVGAGLADVSIKLWGYRIFAVVVLISIIRIIRNLSLARFKRCIASASIIPIYLVVMFVVLICFQEFYVGSSELDKEKTYIGYNIEATKEAFGIDISQTEIENYETLNAGNATANADVIKNIPIVNLDTINETISDTQGNETYYSYESGNLGIYEVDGENKLVSITPREIINDSNRSYNNKTYEYTHGYSVVSTLPSEIDENGYVRILQDGFDLDDGEDNVLNIVTPQIYFGLDTDNPIIVNSSYGDEFDYPLTASTYSESSYDGEAGLHLNFIDRLLVGISTGNYNLAFSDYDEDSKIITNRNILDRVKTLLPYITYDENPYLVVTDDGRLVWVIDGYTTSNEYPYSQSVTITNSDGTKTTMNYIRNSVKVLVDSYDGTTKFYITDRNDPIIMMYRNLYPDLFQDLDEAIPEDIAKNLIYPQYLFDVQSEAIATYHDITEDMLYRADDVWSIATDGENQIESNYTMLNTLDGDKAELGIVKTYTKAGKGSLTAYVVGTTLEDGTNKLSLYKLPSDNSIIGVSQLNTMIEEDETISSELELLDVSGVEVIKDVIIVPIENSILYVEPVYQKRLNEQETMVLKKVIVSSGNKVAIGNNLNDAVVNLLSDNNSFKLEYVDMEDINQVIDSIIEANNNYKESLESGDLEMMGKDLSTLEALLEQLELLRAEEKTGQNKLENND